MCLDKDGCNTSTFDYAIHPDHPPIEIASFPKAVAKLHKNDNIGFKEDYKVFHSLFNFPKNFIIS